MLRRDFLVIAGAFVALGSASSAADPLAEAPRALRKRLLTFAKVVERHAWSEAVGYFDPEHHAAQHKLYFSPELNEDPPNPGDPSAQDAFSEWYLIETLGLGMVDNHVDTIEDVVGIRYRGVEELPDGPLRILFDVDTREGPKTGWFFVDRESLAFFGSVG